jgi:uncharacterized protein (DUF983 family)
MGERLQIRNEEDCRADSRFAVLRQSVQLFRLAAGPYTPHTGRQDVEENKTQGAWLKAMETGARGRCPRCGEGHIFSGFLTVREQCESCGLRYDFADPADGPAVFVQLFACVPGVVFILMLEILARPPLWVHLLVGAPVLVLTTLLPLRPIKGWLIAAQYATRAQEAGTAALWAKLHDDQGR